MKNIIYFKEGPKFWSDADFSKMREYGISEKEIQNLKDTVAIVETAKLVPDNIDLLLDKFDKTFPNDMVEAAKKFYELASENPLFFTQLVAAIDLAEIVQRQLHVNEVKEKQELENALNEFVDAYKNLSPEEKELFAKNFENLI